MSKQSRQTFKRANSGVDRYKHESPRERQQRHQEDVERAKQAKRPAQHVDGRGFDVTAWDRMHTEAEEATLFQGRRAVHVPGVVVRP